MKVHARGDNMFADTYSGSVKLRILELTQSSVVADTDVSNLTNDSLMLDDLEQDMEVEEMEEEMLGGLRVDSAVGRSEPLVLGDIRERKFHGHGPPSRALARSSNHNNGNSNSNCKFDSPSRGSLLRSKKKSSTPETVLSEEDWNDSSHHPHPQHANNHKNNQKRMNAAAQRNITSSFSEEEKEVTIYVDDYKTDTFSVLVHNLSQTIALKKVEIYRLRKQPLNVRMRDLEEMAMLFAAIRGLPFLKELVLFNFDVCDLDLISMIVNQHPTLERFHLHFVQGTIDVALLDILQEAPCLEWITLEVHDTFPLAILMASSTLTHLTVPSESFRFQEEHMVAAMQALEQNKSLIYLDLKPKLSSLGIQALSFGVEDNGRLQELKFSYVADVKDAGKALSDLSRALSRNSKLKYVKNHYSKAVRVKSKDIMHMLQLIKYNETLEEFDFFDDNGSHTKKHIMSNESCGDENTGGSGWMCGDFQLLSTAGSETMSFFRSRISSSSLRGTESTQENSIVARIQNEMNRSFSKWSAGKST